MKPLLYKAYAMYKTKKIVLLDNHRKILKRNTKKVNKNRSRNRSVQGDFVLLKKAEKII